MFWGNGEFALEFGDYDVNITVPSDHILDATGVFKIQKRFCLKLSTIDNKAQNSYEEPVIIVCEDEVIEKEKSFLKTKNMEI